MQAKKVDTKEELLLVLKDQATLADRFSIERLGIFGSFAHGNPSEESDIDFLVEFKKGQKTFKNFIRLVFFLEEISGRKVEMLTPESLSPYIGPYILQDVEYLKLNT